MKRSLLFLLFVIISLATLQAQSFKKAIFRHKTEKIVHQLRRGMTLTAYLMGTDSVEQSIKGTLVRLDMDSLVLKNEGQNTALPLASIQRLKVEKDRKTLKTILITLGIIATAIGIILLFFMALTYLLLILLREDISESKKDAILRFGVCMVGVAMLIVGGLIHKTKAIEIKNLDKDWTIETFYKKVVFLDLRQEPQRYSLVESSVVPCTQF